MAAPNISEIATHVIANRTRKLADNVTDNNALLFRLRERGRKRTVDGGESIYQELEYQENTNFLWYSGTQPLNVGATEHASSADFAWKQAAVAVVISGLEELQVAGRSRQIDLLDSRIGNAEKTMMNQIAAGCYADGTGTGGKEIGGLQYLVADAPTSGTVGGINRATWSFWQNQLVDFSVESLTPGSTTIQTAMNRLYLETSRGRDKVDLIVADNTYWRYYLESLQTNQRFTNTAMAEAGFDNLKYMGADVVFDGGNGGACPANHMYFLNTDYLFYRPHASRDMVMLSPERHAVNQDAFVRIIGWAGNMTMSNAFLQGVLIA